MSCARAPAPTLACPICRGRSVTRAFRRDTAQGVLVSDALHPTSSGFGTTLGPIVRCSDCGHGWVHPPPDASRLAATYAHVDTEVHEDHAEDIGRRATAMRDLRRLATLVGPDRRRLLDVGCWSGALLGAAGELGWAAAGIEPSEEAAGRARAAGLDVRTGVLGGDDGFAPGSLQVVTCCDVLEHLVEPRRAIDRIVTLLEPGGTLFVTVPDFGSMTARALRSRWWSVLPMHVQYFTRVSMRRLLADAGLRVVDERTHPKVFTRRYYGDRLAAFVPGVGAWLSWLVRRHGSAEQPAGPDLRDRLAVVATVGGG